MERLIWFVFFLQLIEVGLRAISLCKNEYPEIRTRTAAHDVIGLLLSVALAIWAGFLLYA